MKTNNTSIEELLNVIRKSHWKKEYQDQVTDAQAMGILMSHYFDWNGLEILKATYEALKDSNFHTVNEEIEKIIKQIEKIIKQIESE